MNQQDSKTTKRRGFTTAAAVAVAFGGMVVGASAVYGYTLTLEPEKERVTETVESTPAACVEALDAAQTIFGLQAEFNDLSREQNLVSARAIEDAVSWNVDGITQATEDTRSITADMNALTDRIEDVDFLGPNESCRAAVE